MPLSNYLEDTAELINDLNYSFTSKRQMTRWVNEARKTVAKQTGCVRRLISGQSAFGASAQPGFAIPGAAQPGALPNATPGGTTNGVSTNLMQTIPNVERYPYEGFFNPALQAQYAGVDKVIDIIELSINWGGVDRPVLDWMPWDDLQAYARAYSVLNTAYPAVWSCYNDGSQGEVWVFPTPSQAGEIEADVFCLPKDVYADSDFDAIPHGMQDAVKYAAAELAFMSRGLYQQAQLMSGKFQEKLGVARVAFDRGKTATYYPSVF